MCKVCIARHERHLNCARFRSCVRCVFRSLCVTANYCTFNIRHCACQLVVIARRVFYACVVVVVVEFANSLPLVCCCCCVVIVERESTTTTTTLMTPNAHKTQLISLQQANERERPAARKVDLSARKKCTLAEWATVKLHSNWRISGHLSSSSKQPTLAAAASTRLKHDFERARSHTHFTAAAAVDPSERLHFVVVRSLARTNWTIERFNLVLFFLRKLALFLSFFCKLNLLISITRLPIEQQQQQKQQLASGKKAKL